MMIVEQLVVQHQTLRNKAPDRPNAEDTGRVTTTRPDIALPDVHWGVWAIAILLLVGGAIIVIWPRLSGGNSAEAETLTEATQIAETALLATQTAHLYEATATAILEFQATAATEAPQAFPVTAEPSPANQPSGPISYTVQSGDTLFGIARRYGVSVNDIMTINGLTSQSLSVGQTLVLPNPPLTLEVPVTASTLTGVVNPPVNPNEQIVKMVIRTNTAVLRSSPGAEFSEINTMARGASVYGVGRNQPGNWYLVQLEDGLTRGWVAAEEEGLIYPAVPEAIPVITTP